MSELLDFSSINDFLTFGLVAPGKSFFQTAKTSESDLWEQMPEENPIADLDAAAEHLHAGLLSSLEFIFRERKPDALALSGGADSRILLSLLSQHFRHELAGLHIYTRVHPQLSVETDRDALLATTLAAHLGLTCEVESPSFHPRAYLFPYHPRQNLVLSGLWGGELLGGQILGISPFQWDDLINHKGESPLRSLCLSKVKDGFARQRVQLLSELIWKSSLTAVYESRLWLSPTEIGKWTASPFLTPIFAASINKISSSLLENYRLQRHYLKTYCGSLAEFDINNPQIQDQPRDPRVKRAVEPKSLPLNMSTETRPDLNAHQIRVLKYIETQSQKKYFSFLRGHLHLIPSPLSH